MVVAADSDEDRKREVEHFSRHAEDHGFALVWRQDGMAREHPDREHFGFRDGISQPGIRGLAASWPDGSGKDDSHQDVVAGGEFVVGYPRERPSGQDPAGDPLRPKPKWTKDGSYTVFRRLRQDVKGFRDFVTAEDAEPNSDRARRDHTSSSREGPCQ
jgi:deferrochelatase/peroxidase EfeB